jgi:two-component system phosphate regulon response regulator PhoB
MNASKSILVVEDEADLADLLKYNLEREGFRCRCATDGESGLAEALEEPPDLLILDRMLPRMSGDQVISRVRREPVMAGLPILMLTAKAEESDELVGFALGADDYITKPFSMKLLLARVVALLRRSNAPPTQQDVLSAGPISLDRDRRDVTAFGKVIALTATEFGILRELIAARGRVLSRNQLIDSVLGETAVVTDRTIDVHVAALRRKLGRASSLIQTVRGVGYAIRREAGERA